MPEPSATAGIPLVDLGAQHRQIAREVVAGFEKVMSATSFVLGDEVDGFEQEFARYCGTARCVSVANGTDAIELALRAAGVVAGDEVVIPANTFIATAGAVERAGARPVLVDVDPDYHLMDVAKMAGRLGPGVRAVVPVHLYGQQAPVEAIRAALDGSGAVMVEDAAQAQGAVRHGVGIGGAGLAAATSFYPGKNLGAYGDAGAVVTDSDEIAERLLRLRNHGTESKYEHVEVGFNSRLDTLQAVVLRAKLARLAGWNEARRAAARRYDDLLAGLPGVRLPATMAGNEHVFHLYVVRVPDRDRVLGELHAAGIGAGIHYPRPVHLHRAYRHLGYGPGDFPVAEAAAGEILSLPLFPEITPDQQERVAKAVALAL